MRHLPKLADIRTMFENIHTMVEDTNTMLVPRPSSLALNIF